jgi:hypothetical protein
MVIDPMCKAGFGAGSYYPGRLIGAKRQNRGIHPVNAAASGLPDPRVSTRLF